MMMAHTHCLGRRKAGGVLAEDQMILFSPKKYQIKSQDQDPRSKWRRLAPASGSHRLCQSRGGGWDGPTLSVTQRHPSPVKS